MVEVLLFEVGGGKMILEIHLENHDRGRPCEIANALIDNCMDRRDAYLEGLITLNEIADHIKVYVNHAILAERVGK